MLSRKFLCIEHSKNIQIQSKKLENVSTDIMNSPHQIFGEHAQCQSYYCQGTNSDERNFVPERKKAALFQILQKLVDVTDHSRNLLKNLNSNLFAKFIGGQKINFTQRRSYQGRCAAAELSHNIRTPLYKLHKKLFNKNSSSKFTIPPKTQLLFRVQKFHSNKIKRTKKIVEKINSTNVSYEPNANKPDLLPDQLEVNRLACASDEIKEMERETILK
ncbi:hypothetical protein PR048_031988 [Dryococelus australis]|uniref:Uncharacterized protein n=1 Tax=Dryococelus australis TaxID=614101 RepID=A0ABQ9G6V7_9NEOP|nr:hypothetical protein PR048_031988 [Dryococelus australis]